MGESKNFSWIFSTVETVKGSNVASKIASVISPLSGLVKGAKAYNWTVGKNYRIIVAASDSARSCRVNIYNTLAKTFLVRFDRPHSHFVNYPHININPKLTGLKKDPHVPISSTVLEATTKTARAAKFLKTSSDWLFWGAIICDGVLLGYNVLEDRKRGTTRNAVEAGAKIAGGWGGGYGGAVGGAAIGTVIFPGIGTVVCGIAGGLSGAVGGSYALGKLTELIGDQCDYDMEDAKCASCGCRFKARKYKDED